MSTKFAYVPSGLADISKVPSDSWAQILACRASYELGFKVLTSMLATMRYITPVIRLSLWLLVRMHECQVCGCAERLSGHLQGAKC